jgi:hypothetical protein
MARRALWLAAAVAAATAATAAATATPSAAAAPDGDDAGPPLIVTGWAPWDAAVALPWQRAVRAAKPVLRGFWHAARDVLFPAAAPGGFLDARLADEARADVELRQAWRRWFYALAARADVPRLYRAHPDAVRLAFGALCGLALLALMAACQLLARAAGAAFVRAAYWEAPGDGADEADEQPPCGSGGGGGGGSAAPPAESPASAPPADVGAASAVRRRRPPRSA